MSKPEPPRALRSDGGRAVRSLGGGPAPAGGRRNGSGLRGPLTLLALLLAVCCGGAPDRPRAGSAEAPPIDSGRQGAAASAAPAGTARETESRNRPGAPARRRLILIGLDAADGRMIAEGVAAGRLPSFARIRREGVMGPLHTHRPILSPILWTTMATGLTPDRHGVLDFIESDAAGRTIPVSARSRRAPAFWNILGDRGVVCGIVGWLATWPAEKINGFIVSDRFTIHPFAAATEKAPPDTAGRTYPPDLYEHVKDAIVPPESLSDVDLERVFGFPRAVGGGEVEARRELRVIESVARTYTETSLRLERERSPDLLVVYYEAIDRMMHVCGPAMSPALPGVPPARASELGAAPTRFYAAMDARLGRFLEAAGPESTVIVVSDHGFKIGAERPKHPSLRGDVFAAEWHRDPGVILAWGRGVRRGGTIENADIYDLTPTILAFFGAPASQEMRGRALGGLFEEGFLPTEPPRVVSYAPAPGSTGIAPGPSADAGSGDDETILENLRALGYVGGGEDAAGRASSNLATFYLDEKQYDRAIAIYQRVLQKDPGDLTALYNLGYAYKGLGSPARAAESFQRLLRTRPDYTEARLVLSECLVSLGRTGEALDLLKQYGPSGDEDAGYQNHLGTVLATEGRLDEASAAFQRAIALRPDEASAYLNLSRVQLARGDRSAALETLRKAARDVQNDPRISARLAEIGREAK